VRGYVVVFEGDDETGYSTYSPDLPGVVAAGATHSEAEQLMVEAMALPKLGGLTGTTFHRTRVRRL